MNNTAITCSYSIHEYIVFFNHHRLWYYINILNEVGGDITWE